jgi:hypothetical protein
MPVAGEFLDEPGRSDRLRLPFEFERELPARVGRDEQDRTDRVRYVDLGGQRRRREALGDPRRNVQVEFVDLSNRPAAGDRDARAVVAAGPWWAR